MLLFVHKKCSKHRRWITDSNFYKCYDCADETFYELIPKIRMDCGNFFEDMNVYKNNISKTIEVELVLYMRIGGYVRYSKILFLDIRNIYDIKWFFLMINNAIISLLTMENKSIGWK